MSKHVVVLQDSCVFCNGPTDDHVDHGPDPTQAVPVCTVCQTKMDQDIDPVAFDDLHFHQSLPSHLDYAPNGLTVIEVQ